MPRPASDAAPAPVSAPRIARPMSQPISSLPELRARLVVALPPLPGSDGEAPAALRAGGGPAGRDCFLVEIFSRLLALGIMEARAEETTLDVALGLGSRDLGALAVWIGNTLIARYAEAAGQPVVDDEEEQVRALLMSHRVDGRRESKWLAAMVGRRGMEPKHPRHE